MSSVYCETPYCGLKITQHNGFLCEIGFTRKAGTVLATQDVLLKEVLRQIYGYIQASAYIFDLPLQPQGTDFQRKVWAALQRIPAGKVRTYGEIATELQSSPRAVGNACRKNPIPLIIPCHRVVSAQGVGGFSGQTEGYKVTIKQQLLCHEGVEF